MKTELYFWAGHVEFNKIPFKHNTIINAGIESTLHLLMELRPDLYYMVNKDEKRIYIDNNRFTQR